VHGDTGAALRRDGAPRTALELRDAADAAAMEALLEYMREV
jgi:hypothetical protein